LGWKISLCRRARAGTAKLLYLTDRKERGEKGEVRGWGAISLQDKIFDGFVWISSFEERLNRSIFHLFQTNLFPTKMTKFFHGESCPINEPMEHLTGDTIVVREGGR
jgi:hypothetical protein